MNNMETKKRIIITCVIVGLVAICTSLFFILKNEKKNNSEEEIAKTIDDNVYEYGIPINLYDVDEVVVEKGDYFSTILNKRGISQKIIYDISNKYKHIFDVKDIQIGKTYHTFFTKDTTGNPKLAYLVYEKDKKSMVVFQLLDTLNVNIIEKEVKTTTKFAEVTINNSLWYDIQQAGFSPLLALKLSDIYAWTIDFFGLQKGDSFFALYDQVELDGKILDINDVHYSVFKHLGKDYESFYFDEEGVSNKYWNSKGESLKKAFLKAPLTYSRISSTFSYARRHPITRKVRPHTGVDYAAPRGTEVHSIGEGVIVEKGYKGGGGNTIKIKHNSIYTTAYLHLSKYGKDIRVGKRVAQGQIIGYVGSTGSSTGPHLDFRVWKNGIPINPLKMESPASDPIKKKDKELFEAQKQAALKIVSDFRLKQTYLKTIIEPLG